ncbi:MAG: PilZ domain-containing protein [Proteobacteria bacterium]|nr:PilZ domain-containing protein [Pseudomonadota bacterium]
METERQYRNICVLTDRPWDYDAEIARLGLTPGYASSASMLLRMLGLSLEQRASGLVLELDKVMREPGPERDQLFQLSCVIPVLRVLRRGQDREIVYLDDPDAFCSKVLKFSPREVRRCGRVPVMLHGLLAAGDDPSFACPVRASVLDLSVGGGFVSCPAEFDHGQEVRLRIAGMDDPTPVMACIRWCKSEAQSRPLHGFGLHFQDIRPGQLQELAERFLGAQPKMDRAGAGA